MHPRSSWPAVAAAAAFFICLPAKTSAERPPIKPLEPPSQSVIHNDDSDPWRPDNPPSGAKHSKAMVSVAGPEAQPPAQPAKKSEGWMDVILGILRFILWGGAAR